MCSCKTTVALQHQILVKMEGNNCMQLQRMIFFLGNNGVLLRQKILLEL